MKTARRKFLVPIPKVHELDALSEQLLTRCLERLDVLEQGDKAALARGVYGWVVHQAFDLHVLHEQAAILQRRVHAVPSIGGGIASITYRALVMGRAQVPPETRCVSPSTPESASRF